MLHLHETNCHQYLQDSIYDPANCLSGTRHQFPLLSIVPYKQDYIPGKLHFHLPVHHMHYISHRMYHMKLFCINNHVIPMLFQDLMHLLVCILSLIELLPYILIYILRYFPYILCHRKV